MDNKYLGPSAFDDHPQAEELEEELEHEQLESRIKYLRELAALARSIIANPKSDHSKQIQHIYDRYARYL
jgi:hypothetical protein